MSKHISQKDHTGVLNIITASESTTTIGQLNLYYYSSPPGLEVTKIQQQPFRHKLRHKHVCLQPAPFPEFLDRRIEVERVTTALQSRQSCVEVYGKAEIGKSALLRYLAYQSVTAKFRHGMVYHSVYPQPLGDLLQTLFEYFFEVDPDVKPTNTLCALHLSDLQALIILDDVELTQRELERLRNTASKCVFLWASSERHLWAEGLSIRLEGLPLEDALALIERELERPLKSAERRDAQTICTVLNGHPKQILLATALIQNQKISMARMAELLQTTDPEEALAHEVFDSLSERERKPVLLLAALKGLPFQGKHLAALIAFPNIEAILGKLQGSGIIQAHDAYYILSDTLSRSLQQTRDLSDVAKQILNYFVTWAEQPQNTPAQLLEEIDTIHAMCNFT